MCVCVRSVMESKQKSSVTLERPPKLLWQLPRNWAVNLHTRITSLMLGPIKTRVDVWKFESTTLCVFVKEWEWESHRDTHRERERLCVCLREREFRCWNQANIICDAIRKKTYVSGGYEHFASVNRALTIKCIPISFCFWILLPFLGNMNSATIFYCTTS